MIETDRSRIQRPAVLDAENPDSPAARERARAIAHALDPDNNPKPSFSVYSHDDVKLALINLFHGKCAYCESRVNAVSARDIEHFRPKGQIDPGTGEEVIKPGYYWLAADWDNLFLSCPGCNRRQRQLERNAAGEFIFADKATGKLDLFPLRPGAARANGPQANLSEEEPFRLLLNPCIDRPQRHLRYDKEGNVLPRRLQGSLSDRALRSIEVFALKRLPLVEERKARYLDMVKIEHDLVLIDLMIRDLPPARKEAIADALRRKEAELRAFTEEKAAFAGMARWLVRPALRRVKALKQAYQARFDEPID